MDLLKEQIEAANHYFQKVDDQYRSCSHNERLFRYQIFLEIFISELNPNSIDDIFKKNGKIVSVPAKFLIPKFRPKHCFPDDLVSLVRPNDPRSNFSFMFDVFLVGSSLLLLWCSLK